MSSISAQSDIVNMQNSTAQSQAAAQAAAVANGTSKTGTQMDADVFMTLMLKELQNQDPMDPVSNKDFLAQQAQFTQVSETQSLNKNITQNNAIMQTLALVGKQVTLTDPNDAKKTISGTVSEASFAGGLTSIKVNGKDYPITLVTGVTEPGASSSTNTSTNTNTSST